MVLWTIEFFWLNQNLKYAKLTGRYQKTKVNNVYSSCSETIPRFPQKSILGAPLSNIVLNYLLLHAKNLFFFGSDCTGDVKKVNLRKRLVKKHGATILELLETGFTKIWWFWIKKIPSHVFRKRQSKWWLYIQRNKVTEIVMRGKY